MEKQSASIHREILARLDSIAKGSKARKREILARLESIEKKVDVRLDALVQLIVERDDARRSEQRVIRWLLIVLVGVAGLLGAYLLDQSNPDPGPDPVQAPVGVRRPVETENDGQPTGGQTATAPNGQPAEDASSRD